MEGYLARYHSDKVSSITLDLYTEGSLKERLDLAIKGSLHCIVPHLIMSTANECCFEVVLIHSYGT